MAGGVITRHGGKLTQAVDADMPDEMLREVLGMDLTEQTQSRISLLDWSMLVPEPKRGPLDFAAFPFQKELYEQTAGDKELVVKKATQVGVSTFLLRWALYWADVKGLTCLYVFPTAADVYDFSDSRIKPAIEASPYLSRRIPSNTVQNKGLKAIGLGFCVAGDSIVLTRRGLMEARTVQVGDEVLTHAGRWCAVRKVGRRTADTVAIRATGSPTVIATSEHPFLTRKRLPDVRHGFWRGRRVWGDSEWVEAGALDERDALVSLLPSVEDSEGSVEWWWLVGNYLADGCITSDGYGVEIATANADADEHERRLRAGWPRVNRAQRPHHTSHTLWGRELVEALLPFGRGAAGKTLTAEALCLSREKSEALLSGWLAGDGYRCKDGSDGATTVSRALAVGMAMVAQRARNVVCLVNFVDLPPKKEMPASAGGKIVNQRGQYRLRIAASNHQAFTAGDHAYKPIRSIEAHGLQTVWNIEVENDESFLVDGVLSHNCYFRGSESKRRLDSIDADILALDEYDTLAQENIGDAERRISGSLVGLTRRIGVPSLTDFGIEREWLRSDMRRWMVKCESCKTHQYLAFNNITWDKARTDPPFDSKLVCYKCAKPGLNVLQGEWVPEHPERGMRGYHMPRMIAAHVDLDTIVGGSLRREPYLVQVHKNKDLAEPHDGEGNRLSKEEIAAAQRNFTQVSGYAGDNPVVMGVDVASTRALTVRISELLDSGESKCLFIGEVDGFDEVDKMIDRYRVNMACIDHLPEGRLAMGLAEKYAGRVYLVNFAQQDDVLKVNEEMRRVSVRRVEMLDATIQELRAQRNLLPQDLPPNYTEEMKAPVRRVERNEEGKVVVRYISTGPDDMSMAEGYALVATEVWVIRQAVGDVTGDGRMTKLEDHMEYQRSDLGTADDGVYSEGLGDGSYDLDELSMTSFD